MTQSQSLAPAINQIALSVVDLRLTEQWFREGLGFLPAGGSRFMASSPLTARIQGLPKAATTIWWMVGRDSGFQLELFQYRRPVTQLMPSDFRPCDIGYTRMGVTGRDFVATLARLSRLGGMPLAAVQGQAGERRVCVRNPDGVYVEIRESRLLSPTSDPARKDCHVDVDSVTLSTPNLAASVAYFTAVSGRAPENHPLHAPEHEALWGLEGAVTQSAVFKAGAVRLEVVEYSDPIGKPWPKGYRICDQGILNIGFGANDKRAFNQIYSRITAFGATPSCAPIHLPFKPRAGVVYVNDPLGFSVELVWMAPGKQTYEWGWHPLPQSTRPDTDNQCVVDQVLINAPLDTVWAALNDQDGMSQWIGFDEVRVIREGRGARDGVGSERYMRGSAGKVVEQVVDVVPKQSIRYRVIEGSPFVEHQGHIRLTSKGLQTEVNWAIRFRSRVPFVGGVLRFVLQRMLGKILNQGLKRYVERH